MSKKSIIASILVVIGIIISFITTPKNFNIDLENPEHIAAIIGMATPGILIAIIIGLTIALIVRLFSKQRTKNKFFLTFSVFFFLTVLMIAYGTNENQKIESGVELENSQEFSL